MSALRQGGWCRQCGYQRLAQWRMHDDGLEKLQAAAIARGGRCLSERYAGVDLKHRFRCARGHEWDAVGHSILKGRWCRECVRESRRLSIETMRQIARERGGECLSEVYVMCKVKLAWRCAKGHEWSTMPEVIRRGRWCPQCANIAKITRADSKARLKYEASYRDGVGDAE